MATRYKKNMKTTVDIRFRNPIALAAWNRKGGAMKSRNALRGGNRNLQRDYLDLYEENVDILEEIKDGYDD